MVMWFKTPCLILVIGMQMMLETTMPKQEMITEMGLEMETAEGDTEGAEVIVVVGIKMGTDPAIEVTEDIEVRNAENEIIGTNIMEEEAVDVVEAQEKEMIGEDVVKIDKDQEMIEEAKTSEERKDQT